MLIKWTMTIVLKIKNIVEMDYSILVLHLENILRYIIP